jgi:hypothetical protein
MESNAMTLRLTEDQRRQVRKLMGRDLEELRLVVMAGPEPVLLAWAWPRTGEKISSGKRHLGLGEAQESRLAPLVCSL